MASTPKIEHTCDWCGQTHFIYSNQLKNTHICCSKDCAGELKKSLKGNNVTCCICDKPFYIKPSHLQTRKDPARVTCSYECAGKARSIWFTGEGNHQYGLKGDLNASHKSDFRLSPFGYILAYLPNHPNCMYDGYVFFHRILMEDYLREIGEYNYLELKDNRWVLQDSYSVHHIDHVKTNNTLSNLMICSIHEHMSLHGTDNIDNRDRDIDGTFLPQGKSTKLLNRAHKLDAGQDIVSSETTIVPARGSKLIGTGLSIAIPKGFVGLLWSRSGLSVKYKLEVGAGCIDAGYTGEVKVHLYNHSDLAYTVNTGDKIAQLLTIPINMRDYIVVDELEESGRGDNGFGSTGR